MELFQSLRQKKARMLAVSRSFTSATRVSRILPVRAAHPVRTYSTGAPSLLELVKALRKETKAGIADCRDALVC